MTPKGIALEALNIAGKTCAETGWDTWECQSANAWAEHVARKASPVMYAFSDGWYLILIAFVLGILVGRRFLKQ